MTEMRPCGGRRGRTHGAHARQDHLGDGGLHARRRDRAAGLDRAWARTPASSPAPAARRRDHRRSDCRSSPRPTACSISPRPPRDASALPTLAAQAAHRPRRRHHRSAGSRFRQARRGGARMLASSSPATCRSASTSSPRSCKKVAATLGEEFDIEILEMHHRMKVDAPSGTALLLGEAAAAGRAIALKERSVRSRDGHTGARRSGDIGFATLARRHRRRRALGHLRRPGRAHRAVPTGRGPRPLRSRRDPGGAVGARQEAGLLHHGRRARTVRPLSVPAILLAIMETQLDRLLVLVRHGQSEWNLKNLFTGWKDPGLTDARRRGGARPPVAASRRAGLPFDVAFTSVPVAGAGDAASHARGDRPAGPADARAIRR